MTDTENKFRNLRTFEHLFAAYGETGAMVFSIAARVHGKLTRSELTHALAVVQARHPAMNVSIAWDEGNDHCFVKRSEPVPLTIMADTTEPWYRIAEAEVNRPFHSTNLPLTRASASIGDTETTVVLTFHHGVADGLSAVHVMHEILVVLGGGKLSKPTAGDYIEERLGLDAVSFRRAGSDRDPSFRNQTRQQQQLASVSVIELESDKSERFVRMARMQGATVHSTLVTALARAQISLDSHWSGRVLRVMSPIDVKPLLAIPEQVGVFISIAITPFESNGADFWDGARRVKQQIGNFQKKETITRVVGDMSKRFVDDASYEATCDRLVRHIPYDTTMTNFGVVNLPMHYGNLTLERIWAPVLRSVPGQDVVAASTFNGILSLVHTSVGGTQGLLDRMIDIIESSRGF